jgi:hypothetical protein
MGIRKRRSYRSGRAPLPSPGRPPVAGRSELQRFWLGIAQGMTSEDAALAAGMSQPVETRLFRQAGGMAPAMFRSSTKPRSGGTSRLRNVRRSHFFAFRAFRDARSDADLTDPHRPSPVSYDACPPRTVGLLANGARVAGPQGARTQAKQELCLAGDHDQSTAPPKRPIARCRVTRRETSSLVLAARRSARWLSGQHASRCCCIFPGLLGTAKLRA